MLRPLTENRPINTGRWPMSKNVKIILIIFNVIISISIIRYSILSKKIKTYIPGEIRSCKYDKGWFTSGFCDGCKNPRYAKRALKQLGFQNAYYFADGTNAIYPENPHSLPISLDQFKFSHFHFNTNQRFTYFCFNFYIALEIILI